MSEITSAAELRELLGEPLPRAVAKERVALHDRDLDWIAASPFLIMATGDEEGNLDASPKGDPAGSFAHVIDRRTLAIPERPGNRRADGYLNILRNPHVGLLFLIPGRGESLRVNGRARLVRDAPYFDLMTVKGHRPILAVEVAVEQIFFHCAKALMRSHLWQPETWQPDVLPSHARITKDVMRTPESLAELESYYAPEAYARKLYQD
ncbi:pyridoxamine 5'-phosphate oxidase family protein [Actinocorallia sp. API 0066]|uniref:pyridoxamine 5'-phosphate oxidase family protein n=1 Tax=Actinocorallia sp. API 0066 TaxID=2896846 RepID=UPI001E29C571|nr:pyridoxamine 5'-phosphate oxidase family protein [Actinocorallia sp. API 0066]MCD0451500.1 pyridoxamine 5'-phosphate oxidase family protein [Actinocorallia sp. API 0066]